MLSSSFAGVVNGVDSKSTDQRSHRFESCSEREQKFWSKKQEREGEGNGEREGTKRKGEERQPFIFFMG